MTTTIRPCDATAPLVVSRSSRFRRHRVRGGLVGATVLYLAVVALMTLVTQLVDNDPRSTISTLLNVLGISTSYDDFEAVANVMMFVPFGALSTLWLGSRRWLVAVIGGFLLSGGIETAQLVIPGRVCDPEDILANTIGALVGALFAVSWSFSRRLLGRGASA